jgi:16S rRNA (guanine527-N7)-methyltransferase
MPEPTDIASDILRQAPIELSDAQLRKLAGYVELFIKWNAQFHFSKYTDLSCICTQAVLPSLSLALLVQDARQAIDLGSGPGIPGIPIAIARPDLEVVCIDSKEVAIEFVQVCINSLALTNVRTCLGRAEKYAQQENIAGRFDLVLSRAFARLPKVLEVSAKFLAPGGRLIVECSKTASSTMASDALADKSLGMLFDKVLAISSASLADKTPYVAVFHKAL